jgi:P27 family predicted phage terminase small subunit
MRGRKPVPYKLKILTQSAPGFDRGGHKIVVPPPFAKGGVQKPTDLSGDASDFWDKVVPELERLEIVGESNVPGLVAMAETYARMMTATRIIRTEGVLGRDPDKARHPAIGVVEEASRNLRGYLAAFGLMPADEVRLGLTKRKEQAPNPFAYQGVKNV